MPPLLFWKQWLFPKRSVPLPNIIPMPVVKEGEGGDPAKTISGRGATIPGSDRVVVRTVGRIGGRNPEPDKVMFQVRQEGRIAKE